VDTRRPVHPAVKFHKSFILAKTKELYIGFNRQVHAGCFPLYRYQKILKRGGKTVNEENPYFYNNAVSDDFNDPARGICRGTI
jgi:hypothetical protein